jgi:hypothetical protein
MREPKMHTISTKSAWAARSDSGWAPDLSD